MKKHFRKQNLSQKIAGICMITLTISMLCGCVRWHCKRFPAELSRYMPYTENQAINFIDNTGSSITLTAKNIYSTRAEKLTYMCKCTCMNPEYSMCLEYKGDTSLYFAIVVPFVDDNMYTDEIDPSRTKYLINDNYIEAITIFSPVRSEYPIMYDSHHNDDEILFTSKKDDLFFDSIRVIYGGGIVSFCTADGRKYHLER